MANQTLTNTILNFDDASIGGLTNGETITINNSTLIIDSDVRWNQQASVIGAMTISSTLGGNINVLADETWEIPFGGYNLYYDEMSFLLSSELSTYVDSSYSNCSLVGSGNTLANSYYGIGQNNYYIIPNKETMKLSTDIATGDRFGWAIDIDGAGVRIIVSALHKTVDGYTYAGQAYIFRNDVGVWIQEAIIQSNEAIKAMNYFGLAVSISWDGTRAIVSCSTTSTGTAAFIFSRSGTTWTQEAKLVPSVSEANDNFGCSVSINNDGSRVIIGAYTRDNGVTDAGAAYIFSRSGTVWTQEQILVASDKAANDRFGYSVDIDNSADRVIIGANNKTVTALSGAGGAYIFSRSGTVWTQEQALVASDKAANAKFGSSVHMTADGIRVIVGAPDASPSALANAGEAYIFSRSVTTWTEEKILLAADMAAGDKFGTSVCINSALERAIVGSYLNTNNPLTDKGSIYVYKKISTNWPLVSKIISTDSNMTNYNEFSRSLSMAKTTNTIVTGANKFNADRGNMYIYENSLSLDFYTEILPGTSTIFNMDVDFSINFNLANLLTTVADTPEVILISLNTNSSGYAALQIYIDVNGKLCFRMSSNGTTWGSTTVGTTTISVQNKYVKLPNILFTKTGTTYRIFYNGVYETGVTYATALMLQSGSLKHYIGRYGIFVLNELAIFRGISFKTDTTTFIPLSKPFDYTPLIASASSGNTPANNALNSNTVTGVTSGATGELLRVFSEANIFSPASPVAYSTAMPKAGFIKLRKKTGNFITGETINLPGGGTIKALGEVIFIPGVGNIVTISGKRSWINVVGRDSTTVTVPRLGKFYTKGDNYYLGETNGLDNQTFQYPIVDICPGLEIETSPGSNVYETYINAGGRWAISDTNVPFIATDKRGQYFYTNASNGVIEIARRGFINLGYKPPAGCKVRIPNILCSTAINTSYHLNTNSDTFANRYDFTTTLSGEIEINNASVNWYISLANPYSVTINNSNFLESVGISNCPSIISINNIGIGIRALNLVFNPFVLTFNTGEINLEKIFAARAYAGAVNLATVTISDCQNVFINNIRADMFGLATKYSRYAASDYPISIARVINFNIDNVKLIGGALSVANGCVDGVVSNIQYADILTLVTDLNIQIYAIYVTNAVNITLDGFKNFDDIINIHPYTGIVNITSTSKNIITKNIGTKEARYNCGTINACRRLTIVTGSFFLFFKNIYLQNTGVTTTNSIHSIANTCSDVIIENVHGDDGKTQSIICNNLISRSCSYTPVLTGQNSIFGSTVHDYFVSDTIGNITFMCNEPLESSASQAVISYKDLGFVPDLFVNIPAAMVGNVTLSNSNRRILFNNYVNSSGLDLPYTDFITSYNDLFVNDGSDEQLKNYVEIEVINTNSGGLVLGILVNRTINETLTYYGNGTIRYYNSLNGSSITIIQSGSYSIIQGDIIGISIDRVLNKVLFHKNGDQVFDSSDYIATTLTNFTCQYAKIAVGTRDTSLPSVEEVEVNFGQKSFVYAIPYGFYGKYGHTTFSKYNAAGSLLMNYPGNEIIFEMPYFAIGHTGVTNTLPALNCYNNNLSFYGMEFQYDTGLGYNGTWLDLKSTSLNSLINDIDPTVGFKLKVKIFNKNNAVTSDYITSLTIETETDAVSKYTNVPPEAILIKAEITNVMPNSRVYVYNFTKSTVIHNDIITTDNWTLYYENDDVFSINDTVQITVTYFDGLTSMLSYKDTLLATASGWSSLCEQLDDAVYTQNNIDGSTVTGLSVTIPYVIDINRPLAELYVQDLYAWVCYYKNTSEGISTMTKAFTAIDYLNYRINQGSNWTLNNILSNVKLLVSNGYLFTEDNTVPIYEDSYSIWFNSGRAYSAPLNTAGLALEATSQSILTATGTLAQESSFVSTNALIMASTSNLALEDTSQSILKTARTIVGLTA